MAVATGGDRARQRSGGRRSGVVDLARSPYNLANLVSIGRLIAGVPVVWLVLADRFDTAFWLFLAAGVSDVLDGFIAKIFNSRTSLGALLDPVADKVLLTSVFLVLAYLGLLPVWLIALVMLRDGLLVVGTSYLFLLGRMGAVRPLLLGKMSTFVQIVLGATVLGVAAGIADLGIVVDLLIYAAGALTLVSGLIYLRMFFVAWLGVGKSS